MTGCKGNIACKRGLCTHFLHTATAILPYCCRSAADTRRSASAGGDGMVWAGVSRARARSSGNDHSSAAAWLLLLGGCSSTSCLGSHQLPSSHSQVRSLSCSHRRMSLVGSAGREDEHRLQMHTHGIGRCKQARQGPAHQAGKAAAAPLVGFVGAALHLHCTSRAWTAAGPGRPG